jgi:hypothetical protein
MPTRTPTNPYLAGLKIGVLVFLAYALTQNGLCSYSSLRQVGAGLMTGIAKGHANRLEYFAGAGTSLGAILNHPALSLLLGTLLGAFWSARRNGRSGVETVRTSRMSARARLLLALAGGVLMGWGAGMARGSFSEHALSGAPLFSAGGWLVLLSIVASAHLAVQLFHRLWD